MPSDDDVTSEATAEKNKDDKAVEENGGSSSSDLFREDWICNQTTEQENAFYKALLTGFQSLKEARENKKTPLFADDGPVSALKKNHGSYKMIPMHVTVNFIDPTTRPASLMSPKPDNLLSKSRLTAPPTEPTLIENVFEKLSHIFERDYGATLRGVQYKNPRSGESDVISSIPVQMILTRTGNASGTGEAANVAWGGMASSAATPSTDPAEWHNAPFCHVYIAACESMEHYRSKVRPSLQAFVSQLEASFGPPTSGYTSSVMGSPGGSAQNQSTGHANYLIVFVPTGGSATKKAGSSIASNNEDTSTSSGPVRRVLATQFAKARERITNYQQELDNNSTHSKDSLASGDNEGMDDDPDSAAASLSLQLLSTNEKLLYKKLVKDFASGKVCVLSKTSLEKVDDSQDDAIMTTDSAGMAIRTQEWNAFNRMLGTVIVNGFKDRCRRYNDELRRLDAQRATAAQAAKTHTKTTSSTNGSGGTFFGVGVASKSNPLPPAVFNLGYFFLVKESLAFTYEQMQLPAEAMLQYDEFRAFLPDLTDDEYKKAIKLRRKSKALQDDSGPPLVVLADEADFVGFRKRLRAEFDLTPILEIVRRYLFAREIRLLFKMEQPVELISRCEAFCKHMYSVMMRCISDFTIEERKKREKDAAKWVVQFAWDVKSSCGVYLRPSGIESTSRESCDSFSVDTLASDVTNESAHAAQSDQNVASRLGELLEMARLLFKELGDVELANGNPLRRYEQSLPEDMSRGWEPWSAPPILLEGDKPEIPSFGREGNVSERQFLLEDAFSSLENYEKTYLALIGAIFDLSQYGNRRRLAFRLQGEFAEYLIRTGNLRAAAAVLKSTVKIYRWDQWDRCHFWRLFRLSFCQRSTASPTDYLKTLATCFGPRTAAIAPKKALEALQEDLERVIEHPMIGESKYGTIAFLETAIEVSEISPDESAVGTGVDRKQILKRFCAVGESISIQIILMSHLPREIELDSLKLFIVELASFTSIIDNRESVEEEDSFKTLVLENNVKLLPGKNTFTFDWAPSTAGQFILSTVEIVWKQGFFYYDSMELPAPLFGVDVLPSKPTHSVTLNPPYLVPGHDQEVQIIFDAGYDLVTAGIMQLSCSEGITMIGPGEELADGQWKKSCEVNLGRCKPSEKIVLAVHIRCALIDTFSHDSISQVPSFDTAHGLSVKAFTKYLHAAADITDNSATTQEMKTILEAFSPILEKTALSVESVIPTWLVPGERLLISVNLMSNTPDHFSIVDFNFLIPPPLVLDTTCDLNSDLRECCVSDGDYVALTFECTVRTDLAETTTDDSILQVKLCDDNKKVFTLDLPLDLNALYLQVLESSEVPKAAVEAKACLKLAADEGIMGEPVKLTFTVETQAEGDIVYSIDSEGSDWLVAGKVNGSMQRSGFMSLGFLGSCDVVGIPTIPGVLTTFPKIEIGIASMKSGYTPLKVKLTLPDSFRSKVRPTAVGVAFPTNKIAV